MLFLISILALVIGAALWWIDEVSFEDDVLDIRWRKRLGFGAAGTALMVLGAAGIIIETITRT